MTILTGVGNKFMEELPLGIHILSEGFPSDIIKVALYGPNAILHPSVDTYVTNGEISGGGYTAGGFVVPSLTIVGAAGSSRNAAAQFDNPYINPTNDQNLAVTGVAVRGMMMYNETQGSRNMFVMDFGSNFVPSVGIQLDWGLSHIVFETDVLIPILKGQM